MSALFGTGEPATESSAEPEAELWFGSHPASPARFRDTARWPDLAAWEQEQDEPLPFLVKVLAVGGSLSIQSHPSQAQAQAGFDRENALGIPVGAPERCYRDPHAKPELLVALQDGFEALCGFRDPRDVVADLDLLDPPRSDSDLRTLAARILETGLAATTAWLLGDGPEVDPTVERISELARADAESWPVVSALAEAYPGDPGIVVAMLLNHVVLSAGEALFLDAGTVHAYLSGYGLEVMGPSDNVLRGGLTPKHIDVDELVAVSRFEAEPATFLEPRVLVDGVRAYRPRERSIDGAPEFELLEVTGPAGVTTDSAAVLIVIDGEFGVSAGEGTTTMTRGDAALVDAAGVLDIVGSGTLFLAARRAHAAHA